MKRAFCLILAALLLCTPLTVSALSGVNERVVLGADLSEDQIAKIYEDFGVERGSMRELTVSNAEEHEVLGGLLDESAIGSASYSCVYMKLLSEGSGSRILRHNIDWCTEEMYGSALSTAGIEDVSIVVSAPFPVSGTCALVGIYKAYEDITGETLSREARELGVEQLLLTGKLAEEIGSSYDAAGIVDAVKALLQQTEGLSDEELASRIRAIASDYRVSFNDAQIQQLLELCRKLEGLSEQELREKAEEARQAAEKLKGWKEKFDAARGKWNTTRQRIGEFSRRLSEWGSGVKESWNSFAGHTSEFWNWCRGFFGDEPAPEETEPPAGTDRVAEVPPEGDGIIPVE
ncbi:MAG: DUF1002 domain-containing protein [bacterium]|nr:DUF1002 domain-containing protein [bacterium]